VLGAGVLVVLTFTKTKGKLCRYLSPRAREGGGIGQNEQSGCFPNFNTRGEFECSRPIGANSQQKLSPQNPASHHSTAAARFVRSFQG